MPMASGPPIRLLYVCHDPIPSHETRTEQLVQSMSALSAHGFDTTLAIPESPVPPGPSRSEEIRRFYGLASDSRFPAAVAHLPPIGGGSAVRLALHDVRAVRTARHAAFDLVYTRDEFALMVALVNGLPTVFETYRADLNELRRFWPFRRFCYSRTNLLGVVAHSRYAMDRFLAAGIDASKVHLAYNGFDPRLFDSAPTREQARQTLGLPTDARIVAYTGHVEARKGTDILLTIAALMPDVLVLLVGALPGSQGEREFRSEMQRQGVNNVRLVETVDPPAVPVYLAAADCLIVPPTASPLHQHRRTVLPMKIFAYMAAGRPILAPDLPDVREVLVDSQNAVLVQPDQPREAAAALTALLRDPARAGALGEEARRQSRACTWETRAEGLARFLRERLAAHRARRQS